MRRYARGELPEAYFYSRYANPTVAEVERKIAQLWRGGMRCHFIGISRDFLFARRFVWKPVTGYRL